MNPLRDVCNNLANNEAYESVSKYVCVCVRFCLKYTGKIDNLSAHNALAFGHLWCVLWYIYIHTEQ